MAKHITIEVDAAPYEDHDDCLQAAADDYVSDHPEAQGYDMNPRWADEETDRSTILLDVPRPTITVGSIVKSYDDADSPSDMQHYVGVRVEIDGVPHDVACVVGVPDSDIGSCRASGAGVRPYLTTWWCDSSDHDALLPEQVEAVEDALLKTRARLWREAEAFGKDSAS